MTVKSMFGVLIATAVLSAQSAGMTFTATATVSVPGKASVPVTVHIDRFIADADRETVMATLKANDHAATTKALAGLPDVGYIKLGDKQTPLKYAYERPTADGRLITVVTAQPIFFVGGSAPQAKPKEGYDLALALLVLNGQNTGDGELAPAVRIKADNGAVVTDDYG